MEPKHSQHVNCRVTVSAVILGAN